MGVEHVEVSPTGGHPVVYADWLHAEGAPTVLVYGHYDVQPVDPLDLWDSPPFEPVVRDGRILARGAADDKGQVHMHLRATEAILATKGRLPVNLRFLFEGEEESASEHLEKWLVANRARLVATVAVISDTGFFEAICRRSRSACAPHVRPDRRYRRAAGPPLGRIRGAVENPANALARIIAGLKGEDGRIRIPGFYDDVVELSAADRSALAELPFDEEAYREALGLPALVGRGELHDARAALGASNARRQRPVGGFQGDGNKDHHPGARPRQGELRLVANQDPDRIFELFREYVAQIAPRACGRP